jgi:hypothetical protein
MVGFSRQFRVGSKTAAFSSYGKSIDFGAADVEV